MQNTSNDGRWANESFQTDLSWKVGFSIQQSTNVLSVAADDYE